MPYITVYMKMIGLSPSETALTCGIVSIITAFVRTFIGGVADKLNAHKTVLMLMCVLTATFHGSMLFVPKRTTPETSNWTNEMQIHCGTNGAHVFFCRARPADGQHIEVAVNISSNAESESYAGDGERDVSVSAPACRWTCTFKQQTNTKLQAAQVCFAQTLRKNCTPLHDTITFEFGLNKLHLRSTEDCQALGPSNSYDASCSCYTLRSFIVGHDTFEQMVCQNQTALTCTSDAEYNCLHSLNGSNANNKPTQTSSVSRTGVHFGWIFWVIACLYLLGQSTAQPIFGLADAMAFTVLGEERSKWGRQRLWGTIGFAIFGLVSGILMDAYGHGKNEYTVAFLLFGTFMILASVSACQYSIHGLDVTCSSQVFRDVLGLMRRPDAFVLFCAILVYGTYNGLIVTFLFWYLKLLGDVPQVLFGLCLVQNCLLEIVMLFFSGTLQKRLGHVLIMSIVFVMFAVRMAGYSLLRNPWMVLCVEPLHSITYGLMYASASTYASRITPPGTHGSVQSIIGSLHFSFGELCCNAKM